jgi:molybdenum cofactor biosynthesis protein MoaC
MIDISKKTPTLRTAVATATIKVHPSTIEKLHTGQLPKGDPLPVAKVAAIQAAKNTSQIIPYCHPLTVTFADCQFEIGTDTIVVRTEVQAIEKTGVEMEALTAASAAALTIYDMTKAVDERMEIVGVKLVKKTGGKSDYTERCDVPLTAAVLVVSDSTAAGKREDTSGKYVIERLTSRGIEVKQYAVVPDEADAIEAELKQFADTMKLDLVMTCGGTGLGPRDVTPEATERVIERQVHGIAEVIRAYGQERMPFAMLSRGVAGVRGKTLMVNLPGSRRGVEEALDALLPAVLHAFKMMQGEGH